MAAIPSIRLSELTSQISNTINSVFGSGTFWVVADVSNYTFKPQSNFHYFELVEKEKNTSKILAKISGRAWGNASVNISNFEKATGQQFKNDINVLVQVQVQYNPAFGLQLNLLDIDTSFTLGQFEQQRKETLDRLVRDNPSFIRFKDGLYHTRNSDLQFNKVLQRIAVISSDTSAGYHDFRHTLENNTFGYHFEVDDYFAFVQGEGNAKQVLSRLIAVFESGKTYDALIIIRGGGSQTDFLIFDNYDLNRAIAKFPVPIITGIGHQKNETIADLMAHTSTKTPTKAAELLIAHNRGFEESLLALQQQLVIRTFQLLNQQKEMLNRLNQVTINSSKNLLHEKHRDILNLSGMILTNPKIILSNKAKDLQNLRDNLKSFNRMFFINQGRYISHFESVVRLMSPQNILNKGFAIIKVEGKIVKDASRLKAGDEVSVTLADTEINTKVLSKHKRNGKEFEL